MLVSEIGLTATKSLCELQARIESDAVRKSFLLRYRFPSGFEQFLSPENGDCILAALLIPAMKSGEPLEICAPISPRLLGSINMIQDFYRSRNGALSKIRVKAPIREKPIVRSIRGSYRGLFFSCGVDCQYTLITNMRSPPTNERITHLIVGHGLDSLFGRRDSKVFRRVLANASEVGAEFGVNVLPIATNLRDFTTTYVDYADCYGSALASVALALEGFFEKIIISSNSAPDESCSPLVDPLWSTEHLSVVHHGYETKRLDKIRLIAKSPTILRTLRVCTINSYAENMYNCGHCEKCLRTMIGLYIAGALHKCQTLPPSIDVALLRNASFGAPHVRVHAEDHVSALGSSETDLAIKSALERALSADKTETLRRDFCTVVTRLILTYVPRMFPMWRRLQRVST